MMTQKRRFAAAWASLMLLLVACGEASPEQQAAHAARDYYQLLADQRTDEYLAGRANSSTTPEEYRNQLKETVRQYIKDVNERHGGLRAVDISPNVGRRDSTLGVVYAFLMLTFADSTQEEVMVPMTQEDGTWKMK